MYKYVFDRCTNSIKLIDKIFKTIKAPIISNKTLI